MELNLGAEIDNLGIKNLLEITHFLSTESPFALGSPVGKEQWEIWVGESTKSGNIIFPTREP
jgi:hypothetical protein